MDSRLIELATAVKDMRGLQKEYFRTRDKQVLTPSKAQEKVVDGMVKDILDNQQMGLGL